MDLILSIVESGISFGQTLIGIIVRPYETYRRIVHHGRLWELIYIAGCIILYFSLASLVKTASFRPYLLTKQFVVLTASAAALFLFVSGTLWVVARRIGGQGSMRQLLLAWGYTMIPTMMWFLATSILYVLIPPPRTTSLKGISFSILYLIFSTTLFLWKLTLAYLALRFSLRMDLAKITLTVAISLPVIMLYSYVMYLLGIFKVPFL